MSNAANPFAAVFETQRQTVEQSRRALHQGVALSKQSGELARDGLDSSRTLQQRSTDLGRSMTGSYLRGMSQLMPGDGEATDDVQSVVDEQFDALDEVADASWDALDRLMAENLRVWEAFAEQSLDMVDDAFEATDDLFERVEEAGVEPTESTTE